MAAAHAPGGAARCFTRRGSSQTLSAAASQNSTSSCQNCNAGSHAMNPSAIGRSYREEWTESQRIGAAPDEDVDSLRRRADHGLAVNVQARVENRAQAGSPPNRSKQRGKISGVVVGHDLRAARPIDAGHARESGMTLAAYFVRH